MRHLKTYTQLFESHQKLTSEQKKFLDRYTKGTWSMNPETGLVDVDGDFDCSSRSLKSLRDVQFGHVSGDFNCGKNKLTSLEGAPQSVVGDFSCSHNQLTSLNGSPQSVVGNFDCYGNQLTTLKGAPESVGGGFYCVDNQLTSLEGAPESVGGYFDCSYNQLTSLKGAPQSVDGDFGCYENQLSSLKGAPEFIGGEFGCYDFGLGAGEWNVEGWLKAAQKSEKAAKLLVPLLSEDALDDWIHKNPLDLDILNDFPEIKAGVLKRTGIRDISKLASLKRRGLI